MRELKFRAWNKKWKRWEDPREIYLVGNGRLLKMRLDSILFEDTSDIEMVQFSTGLKDKNGKEIYEGDICFESLNPAAREPGIVTFYEGIFWLQYKNNSTQDLRSRMFFDCEVFGNIYENPELLI